MITTVFYHVQKIASKIQRNKCISKGLMHVAERYRGTARPRFTKSGESFNWSNPNTAKFRCDLDKKCARYLLSKLYAPGKLDKSSSNPLISATHQWFSACKISLPSVKRCTRKALQNFLTPFSILAPQGDPAPKFTNIGSPH